MVIVLMGVSGAGKTTVGRLLAQALGAEFAEGDAYHPAENIAKMRRGIPLEDADRWPWLAILGAQIDRWLAAGTTVVLACSALKQRYRDVLARGRTDVRFVHLEGDKALIRLRLDGRRGHYMPATLLDSQFAALEAPSDAITVDVTGTPELIVADILRRLGQRVQKTSNAITACQSGSRKARGPQPEAQRGSRSSRTSDG
jgi:gluconokinase